MDNLEKYIRNHRKEFDTDLPSEKVWEGINEALEEPVLPRKQTTGWMWKAAAVVLLLTTSYLVFDKWNGGEGQLATSESFDEEFVNAERYYLKQINTLQEQLATHPDQEFIGGELMTDLHSLDSMYNALKKEFSSSGDTERITDALIQNLRIRMEIINQQLRILERVKQQTSNDNVEI